MVSQRDIKIGTRERKIFIKSKLRNKATSDRSSFVWSEDGGETLFVH